MLTAERLIILALLVGPPLSAQADTTSESGAALRPYPRGAVVPEVKSHVDRGQRYAVYLPSRYTPDRRWPLLLLMDPRGRALIPLALVRQSAERYGYIVLSSYNTRSDEVVDTNRDALNAMLADAQQDFSLDERRFYLVGFSGTARAGWEFGAELAGHVAGVIGVGAGLPFGGRTPAPTGAGGPPFAFFGGAGTTDFNYDEVMRLDGVLDKLRWPHRVVSYPGPHTWPEAPVMAQALGWMELQAMRSGLAPVDQGVVDSMFEAEVRAARALEQDGHLLDALLRFRSAASDFTGVHQTSGAAEDTLRLSRTAQVRRERKRRSEIERRQFVYVAKMALYFSTLRNGTRKPESLSKALKHLDVPATQRLAADHTDPETSLAAQRRLEHLVVMTAFYEPRDRFEKNDPAGALAMNDIARAILPDNSYLCYDRVRALAALNRIDEALTALACWLHAGNTTAAELDADPHLAPLRAEPEFVRLRDAL
ncbi:MAG: hypothetical protein ABI587_18160 [Gemmatimonadales bacterium]